MAATHGPVELTVITKEYGLILWSCHHTGKFSCNRRFVLAAAPALAALARRRAGLHRRIVVAGSLAIALAGAGWFVARVAG